MKITTVLHLAAGLLLAAGAVSAQDLKAERPHNVTDAEINMLRKDLRDQKKQIVAANMPLTGDEAAKFWPVYDEYTVETIKINDKRYALVKDYAAKYNSMTEAQASSYIRDWIGLDAAATNLRLTWIPKFEKLLGEKKAAIFFQLDRHIGLMIEIQLASQLPLVQP